MPTTTQSRRLVELQDLKDQKERYWRGYKDAQTDEDAEKWHKLYLKQCAKVDAYRTKHNLHSY